MPFFTLLYDMVMTQNSSITCWSHSKFNGFVQLLVFKFFNKANACIKMHLMLMFELLAADTVFQKFF